MFPQVDIGRKKSLRQLSSFKQKNIDLVILVGNGMCRLLDTFANCMS